MNDSTPTSNSDPSAEISLENIDKLLEADDPDFAKSLDEVKAVVPDAEVDIEASTIEDSDVVTTEEKSEKPPGFFKRMANRLGMAWLSFKNRLKARLIHFGKESVIFLKTRPKEFALFLISSIKVLIKKAAVPLQLFRDANNGQRLAFTFLTMIAVGAAWVLVNNFKGIWLPSINEPILGTFESHADWVEEIDAKEPWENFYSAFPQEHHEFLFNKMKVNLRATAENPLPMGAFEIIVDLDSPETSIEVRDRQVEFTDMLQRVLEDETFNDLATELGKTKLKSRVKRELNQKLTQGWVRDVNFKTFVLKP
jgi:flagellar basal body-associated protein FliL